MRIGADVGRFENPADWVQAHKDREYGACIFPLSHDAGAEAINAFRRAADDAGLVIAEVGAWSNPLDPNPEKRRAAMNLNINRLRLAETVGARCCVNISGSMHPEIWMAPHKSNLSQETFDQIVKNTREIIDAVNPVRTAYTLETMPWCYPDSLDSYARLIEKVNRDAFQVHLDAANLTYSPRLFYGFAETVNRAARLFGDRIRSVHLKDLHMNPQSGNVEIAEVTAGTGELDLSALLEAVAPIGCPVILEHLPDQKTYAQAAAHVKSLMQKAAIPLEF